MTATVKAGEKGVDFSFARPPAARLLELGYTFVVGYVSVPPASSAKNITKPECDAYVAAGLKVLLVWEMSATSPNQGAPLGQAHGRDAKLAAALRQYPRDVPILIAVDTNTTPALIDAHEQYVDAFAEQCDPWPVGIYGDTDILDRCSGLWDIGWVPNAWSWSGSSRLNAEANARRVGAHVLQRQGFYIDNRWAVDPNEAIADFPAWGLEQPTPDPQPPTIDEEEDAVRIKTPGQWFEKCGVDLRAIANGAEYAGLSGNEVILTLAEMEQLLGTCRYTYGDAKPDMGAGFVAAWNAHRQPAPSSGGGSSPYVVTLSGTATPGV